MVLPRRRTPFQRREVGDHLFDTTDHEEEGMLCDSNEEEEGSTMIWVEWLTTGKKECVHENQINRNGLEGRKRSRPSCFSP